MKAKGRDEEGQDVRKKDSTVHNEEFLSHKKNEVSPQSLLSLPGGRPLEVVLPNESFGAFLFLVVVGRKESFAPLRH